MKGGHDMAALGFKGSAGDVVRLSNRIRVVKSFRGIDLEGFEARTRKGYEALMLVFLTHSALEQYLRLTKQEIEHLESLHRSRGSEQLLADIFDSEDPKGKLFDFLHARLKHKVKQDLTACGDRKSCNVAFVSAAIRHIFAHGYLTANPNEMKPEPVQRI